MTVNLSDATIPRLAPKTRLKWDEVRQQHLLVFPEGLLVLNPTAHEIIGLCDGNHTLAFIRQTLRERYNSEAITADVQELLQTLSQKRLMILEDQSG